ncbi:lipopolysaccharide assembly protein LapB [Selenomonas sp. AE3005]|uniref:tetratricopeptide repeat protein n=1 Tax=Selenomonas sp. AE3005 TaxID=1485543 RepID=UPI00048694F0|nr:hypothetical protein [Selenomonas sp. AE3005]
MNKTWQKSELLIGLLLAGNLYGTAQAAPQDYTQLNTAGQDAIRRHDYVAAENYFKQARSAALAVGQQDFLREMDARRAAMYINNDEPSRAVAILTPYIKPGVDKFMLSDYLQALRACNEPKKALAVFQEYVKDWQTFPVYGLENVAAVALRQKNYPLAKKIYESILSHEKTENVPFVQLGYAYTLVRMGHESQAVEAYSKIANIAPRYNNIIAGDASAFILEGQLGIARKLFGLLGKDAAEKETYQLLYAQNLVNVNRDLSNEDLNFQRDERLDDRSYYHEADSILRKLLQSDDQDIVHDARVAQAANNLNNELLADARSGLQKLLAEDNSDMAALTVQNAYENQQLHSLTTYYENSIDNKRNKEQSVGITYDNYIGHNIYLSHDVRRSWLQDDDNSTAYWQSTSGLRKKFGWGEITGEWIRYDVDDAKNGYSMGVVFDIGDAAKIGYTRGMRLHNHVGTVKNSIREKYQTISFNHQLTPKTALAAQYEWADLDDQNKYWEYTVGLNHLLQVKHNFSDRLLLEYSRASYDHEVWFYNSPERREDYMLGWQRKWNYPQIETTWLCETVLGWGHDNDDSMEFTPHIRLEYTKDFPHNQQLRLGTTIYKYFNQTSTENNRRNDGYQFSASYNWRW